METIKYVLFCLMLATCFSACVHEFPDDNPVNPYMIEVAISVDLDMAFDSDIIYQTYSQMLAGNYDVRYIVDVYKKNDVRSDQVTDRVARIVKTENTIISDGIYHMQDTLLLPIGQYEMIAWIDFVDKGTASDNYYNTSNLQQVSILQKNGKYNGYNTTKDAFTGKYYMDLTPFRDQRFVNYNAIIETKRPFAIYQIITTDIDAYMTYHQTLSYSSIRPSTTNLVYNLYFPMGYNAYLFAPDNLRPSIGYTQDIVEIEPGKEALIASDFVFVENPTFYAVDFEIFSADNKSINTIKGLKINLERNKLTIIKAEFLTKDLNPNGKIGVDDGFTDEIIIRI